jgi:hypothetical protein
LYRAAPDYQLLKWTLNLLPRNAEHIDAFISYLSQYSQSKVIMDRVVPMLKKGVLYEYVEGELWQLAARLGQPKEIKKLLDTFKKRHHGCPVKVML